MCSRLVFALVWILITVAGAAPEIPTKGLHNPAIVNAFYESRKSQNVWTNPEWIQELQDAIAQAPLHGLRSADYHFNELEQKKDPILTDAFLTYAHDLRFGRASHRLKGVDWKVNHNDQELVPLLEEAISTGQIHKRLMDLAPSFPAYRLLQDTLLQYRKLAGSGGWPEFQEPLDLNDSQKDDPQNLAALDRLRIRLEKSGDLERGKELTGALLKFQQRHGLRVDAIVGKQTMDALSVTAERRVSQIELNLERLRWMPRELPPQFVIVNVPGFELGTYRENKRIATMRVIVGRASWCTPTFLSSEINQVIVNPYWYVPSNIAKKEIYPLLQKEPDYLERNNIRIIPRSPDGVQLRQSPGPRNALGKVKFLFPNCCDCYLHDTPDKELFERVLRAFSHGCIRVEGAVDLAAWILQNEDWTPDDFAAAIESSKTQTIRLTHAMPLYIVYFTAWIGEDGSAQFRSDVYGKDRELERSLELPPSL